MGQIVLLHLAIILISTKVLGLLTRRIGIPDVVGALLAGIIIGPLVLNIVQPSNVLDILANIGVIMIIFTAGLETNLHELKKTGAKSVVVAIGGMIVPLVMGFFLAFAFNGGFHFDKVTLLKNIFIGIIFTATSITIAIQTLKEMGKLRCDAGCIILSAAILDDVLAVIMLSLILGISNGEMNIGISVGKTFAFFIVAIGLGIFLHKLFKYLAIKYPRKRRLPILALGICFLYAFVAEHVFGIASITGAYIAGLIFAGINATGYIERKIDINAYMLFAPVFFAYIGIYATLEGFNINTLWMVLAFVAMGVASKAIGSYFAARLCKIDRKDSMVISFAMIARGEVALVMLQQGTNAGIIPQSFFSVIVSLVIISSLLTPILIKLCYRKEKGLQY